MDVLHAYAQCKLRHCSQCEGVTEYHCKECAIDICALCKEKHNLDLDTKNHEVKIFQAKSNISPRKENCKRHPANVYKVVCDECKIPVCRECTEHRLHEKIDILTEVKTKRFQHRETIYNIRSEALYKRHVLLACIKNDLKASQQTKQPLFETEAIFFAKIIEKIEENVTCNTFKYGHRCSVQKMKLQRHLARIQKYEIIHEQSVKKPLRSLAYLKKIFGTKKHCCLNLKSHGRLSLSEGPTFVKVIQTLNFMAQHLGNELLLEIIDEPVLKKEFEVKTFGLIGSHMSIQSPDHIWLYDEDNLVLTNTKGEKLFQIKDIIGKYYHCYGTHTVTKEKELIYFDRDGKILKLSKDRNLKSQLPILSSFSCRAYCVYCSPLTGDLILGMCNHDTNTCIIKRYNVTENLQSQNQPQIIGQIENWHPVLITENNNGDIIVAGFFYGVMGIDRSGRYRFLYEKTQSGFQIRAKGICTDSLSHILVSDSFDSAVHMLNKNGQLLSYLLTTPNGECSFGLMFDFEAHLLWIRAKDCSKKITAYRYIKRHDVLAGSEIILSSCGCQSNRATNVGNVMPHPGQEFLKNDAKRKRDHEKHSKNCRENIKRWKQSANNSIRPPYLRINRRPYCVRRNLQEEPMGFCTVAAEYGCCVCRSMFNF